VIKNRQMQWTFNLLHKQNFVYVQFLVCLMQLPIRGCFASVLMVDFDIWYLSVGNNFSELKRNCLMEAGHARSITDHGWLMTATACKI